MLEDGKDPIGRGTSDPGATEGTGEAPQGTDGIASSAGAPDRSVEPRRGVAISTRSPHDPGRPRTPTSRSAGPRQTEKAATPATPAPAPRGSTAASAGAESGAEAGAESGAEAGAESGAQLRGPWRPGPNPSGPWRPGPYPAWAYPPGTQPPGAQPKLRTHIRLFTALGAVVLLVGGLAVAAVVLQQRGSSGPPATGGAPGTATIGTATIASGAATPGASPKTPSSSPTIAAPRGPLTASSSPASGDGAVVFSDDFHNKSSGWPTASQSGFMTFAFTSQGYVINATGGSLHHLVYSPSKLASQQLSVSLTAGLASASTGAGLGVTCRRGEGASEISYGLVVQNDGGWLVTRREGAPSLGALATTLSRGSSAVVPGATPITVVGMCATLGDGARTRLVLFVDGTRIADMVDSVRLPDGGWMGGLLVASGDSPAVATATHYEERDLLK